MNQKIFAVTVAALVAASSAFGQGYVTFACPGRTVWDDYSGDTPLIDTNVLVTFLWATNGVLDPLNPTFVQTNGISGPYPSDWGVIGSMLTNGWQVAYNRQTATYAIAQPINNLGSIVYNGGNAFPLANSSGSGETIQIVVVAWDAASGTNAIFNENGQALGWSAPINYTLGAAPPATPPADFVVTHFGVAPAPGYGQPAPYIYTQPQSQTVLVGGTATFTVAVFGGIPQYFQWFFNGTALDGATNDELQLTNVTLADGGPYWVTVSNSFGSATSSDAYLTVTTPSPPSIVNQPTNFVATALGPASFTVTATGGLPLSYQWSLNGSNILNATSNVFSISTVRQSDLGEYSVLVTNAFGSVMSSVANLDMYPYIQNPFTGLDTYWGQTNTIGVGAWGSGTLNYQWYQNGVALLDATNSTLTISGIQFTNAGSYYVVVSSALGSATNSTYQVIVNPANISINLFAGVVIQGTVGYSYTVESTRNLGNPNSWIVETNLTLTQPTEIWDDNSADVRIGPPKFYQVLPGQ